MLLAALAVSLAIPEAAPSRLIDAFEQACLGGFEDAEGAAKRLAASGWRVVDTAAHPSLAAVERSWAKGAEARRPRLFESPDRRIYVALGTTVLKDRPARFCHAYDFAAASPLDADAIAARLVLPKRLWHEKRPTAQMVTWAGPGLSEQLAYIVAAFADPTGEVADQAGYSGATIGTAGWTDK